MKKIFSLKTMLLLMGVAILVLFSGADTAQAKSDGKYVVDMADILTSSEESSLESYLEEISARLSFDVVVVTTSNLDGKSAMEYADDYFDYNGYGQGSNKSGVLFLRYINGSEKKVWISTSGSGITAINDNYIDHIFNEITSEFSANDYYSAFKEYADLVDKAVSQYQETGNPIIINGNSGNTEYYDEDEGFTFLPFIIPIGVGLIAAFVYTAQLKGQLKSVSTAAEAGEYKTGFELTSKNDRFIRSAVSKVSRESSSSGSGHSSTHSSSSGSSHGGGGRSM